MQNVSTNILCQFCNDIDNTNEFVIKYMQVGKTLKPMIFLDGGAVSFDGEFIIIYPTMKEFEGDLKMISIVAESGICNGRVVERDDLARIFGKSFKVQESDNKNEQTIEEYMSNFHFKFAYKTLSKMEVQVLMEWVLNEYCNHLVYEDFAVKCAWGEFDDEKLTPSELFKEWACHYLATNVPLAQLIKNDRFKKAMKMS